MIKSKIEEGKNDETILSEILGKSIKKIEEPPKSPKFGKSGLDISFLDSIENFIVPEKKGTQTSEEKKIREEVLAQVSHLVN